MRKKELKLKNKNPYSDLREKKIRSERRRNIESIVKSKKIINLDKFKYIL